MSKTVNIETKVLPKSLQLKVRKGDRGNDYHTVYQGEKLAKVFFGDSSRNQAENYISFIETEMNKR